MVHKTCRSHSLEEKAATNHRKVKGSVLNLWASPPPCCSDFVLVTVQCSDVFSSTRVSRAPLSWSGKDAPGFLQTGINCFGLAGALPLYSEIFYVEYANRHHPFAICVSEAVLGDLLGGHFRLWVITENRVSSLH